jgi:hypothetical protein
VLASFPLRYELNKELVLHTSTHNPGARSTLVALLRGTCARITCPNVRVTASIAAAAVCLGPRPKAIFGNRTAMMKQASLPLRMPTFSRVRSARAVRSRSPSGKRLPRHGPASDSAESSQRARSLWHKTARARMHGALAATAVLSDSRQAAYFAALASDPRALEAASRVQAWWRRERRPQSVVDSATAEHVVVLLLQRDTWTGKRGDRLVRQVVRFLAAGTRIVLVHDVNSCTFDHIIETTPYDLIERSVRFLPHTTPTHLSPLSHTSPHGVMTCYAPLPREAHSHTAEHSPPTHIASLMVCALTITGR